MVRLSPDQKQRIDMPFSLFVQHREPRPRCIYRDCPRQDLIKCGNRQRFPNPHHVCGRHVHGGVDEAGNQYCSPECWNKHMKETSSV